MPSVIERYREGFAVRALLAFDVSFAGTVKLLNRGDKRMYNSKLKCPCRTLYRCLQTMEICNGTLNIICNSLSLIWRSARWAWFEARLVECQTQWMQASMVSGSPYGSAIIRQCFYVVQDVRILISYAHIIYLVPFMKYMVIKETLLLRSAYRLASKFDYLQRKSRHISGQILATHLSATWWM